MQKLGKLAFHPGWMGGTWFVGNEPITKRDLPNAVILKIGRKLVNARPVIIAGEDYDMGHTYKWRALDFELKLKTDIGVLYLSLREVLIQRPKVGIELRIES